VKNFEYFKYLHLGLIAPIKRKSFPELSKIVNVSSQSLHHFISSSPWEKSSLETRRLNYILRVIGSQEILVVIDETGDRKKGNKTDVEEDKGKRKLGRFLVPVFNILLQEITAPISFFS